MINDFTFPQPLLDIATRPTTATAKFLERGIVAFRNPDEDRSQYGDFEIIELLTAIGNNVGFTPSWNRINAETKSYDSWRYHQVHDPRIQQLIDQNDNAPDVEVLQWHLEGVSLEHTQRAAAWFMYHFTAPKGTGSTGFVDMQALCDKLPTEYRSFLEAALIIHLPNWQSIPASQEEFTKQFMWKRNAGHDVIWTEDTGQIVGSFARKAIEDSPHTGEPTLRTCPCKAAWGLQDYLLKIDGNLPTEKDEEFFKEIMDWVTSEIKNPDNQIWWEWEQWDVVVPDLFRMAHGVHGGFEPGQRSFWGYWCFPFGVGSEPTTTLSEDEYQQYLSEIGQPPS